MCTLTNIDDICNTLDAVSSASSFECNPENCSSYLPQTKPQLNLITQNIRSIAKNFCDFTTTLQRIGIVQDVIILTECRLSKHKSLPSLEGYESSCTANNPIQNDGVAVYIKSDLVYKSYEPQFTGANCLVNIINNMFVIISIYRSPSYSKIDTFLNSLDMLLTSVSSYKSIVVVGDINLNITPETLDKNAEQYLELLAFHGLLPTHNFPTRVTNCLDHIFIKSKLDAITLVIKTSVTDHDAVMLTIDQPQIIHNKQIITKIHYDAIAKDFSKVDFSSVYTCKSVNICTELLIKVISTIISNNTSRIHRSLRNMPVKPWITRGLLRCIRHRDNLHNKSRKNLQNITLNNIYKRYRNFCNNLLKKLKQKYERTELIKAGKDVKMTWKAIANITNYKTKKPLTDDLISYSNNPMEATNAVNEYFVDIGRSLAEQNKSSQPSNNTCITSSSSLNSFVLLDTDETEVIYMIDALKSSNTAGWDNISSRVIKENKEHIAKPLTYICNLVFETGTFPEALKKSIILPIHKAGDKKTVNNYRPISILPNLSKVVERLINKRLVKYLEKYHLFSDHQYGFRAGKSTSQAFSELNNYVVRALDDGHKCLAIFLDLAKAFDTVSTPLLLKKLENMGVRGLQLQLIESYLTNRKQCVKIGNYISQELTVNYGVPQGSILGPTLFLVYLNEVCDSRIDGGKLIAYADDTALVFSGKTWKSLFDIAQNNFDTVSRALQNSLLTLNATKTNVMAFSLTNKNLPNAQNHFIKAHKPQCLSCENERELCDCPVLDSCTSTKYLGVTLDSQLNYTIHIGNLTSKVRKLIAVFKNIRHAATKTLLKTIYYALCQSILTYCIASWGGSYKTCIIALERAQRAILKVAYSRPFRFPTHQLYQETHILTVRQLFIRQVLMDRKHTQLPKQITNLDPKQSRRKTMGMASIACKTAFAHKHAHYLSTHIYKKLIKDVPFDELSTKESKNMLTKYLIQKNYEETEKLLTPIT